jgi:hypothetical protein
LCVKFNLSRFLTTKTAPQDSSSLGLAPRILSYWRLADAETAPLLRYYGKPTSPRNGYEMPWIPRMWSPEAKHQVLRSPGVRWSMQCRRALLMFAERRTMSLNSQKSNTSHIRRLIEQVLLTPATQISGLMILSCIRLPWLQLSTNHNL